MTTDSLNTALQSLSAAQLQWLYQFNQSLGTATTPEDLAQQALVALIAVSGAAGGMLSYPGLVVLQSGDQHAVAVSVSVPNSYGAPGKLELGGIPDGDPTTIPLITAAAAMIGPTLARLQQIAELRALEQAREQMINLLVHDIRSPLVATHASIEVTQRLLKGTGVTPTIFESLATGLRSVRSAVDLCNDMLEVKRLQSGYQIDQRLFGVSELLGDVAQMLKNLAAQRSCELTWVVNPATLQGCGDVRLLRRVLTNLVTNAIRFTPAHEVVALEGSTAPEGGTLLAVSDRGPGVSATDRERIFEPFIQGSGEINRGTGLGLHFCRHAVQAHGGRIWIEDRSGGGCSFVVWLPEC